MEKTDAMTFCSQLDPQTSTWFDHSAEDSSRTVSYLVRRLRPALYVVSHPGDPAVLFSSTFSRRLLFSNFAIQTLLCTRFPEFNNVELHRPTVRSPVQTNSFQHSSKAVRSSPCPSTMSNSIDQLYELPVYNVELHRQPTLCMPSPAMLNSIDSRKVQSTMSNSIDYPS